MTEPADQPLLEAEDELKKPAKKRATKAKAPETKAATKEAKPRAKRTTKKSDSAQPELPGAAEVAPAAEAVPAPIPVVVEPPAPAPAPVPVPAPIPISAEPAVRPRPIYIPRHVAKELEAAGIAQDSPEAVAFMQNLVRQQAPAHTAPAPVRVEVRMKHHPPQPQRERERETVQPEVEETFSNDPVSEESLGVAEGIVEVSGKGFGFLRDPNRNFSQHPSDVFVTPEICRSFNLRDGQWLKGETRRGNRGAQIYRVIEINGEAPEKSRLLPAFDELTVLSPMEPFRLETVPERFTTRIVDLMAPIGKGQRGLIVAPPRTGKTTLLQHIAEAVKKNHPDVHLMILLVDERPEEVTEFKRTLGRDTEIMASSNDSDVKSHTRIAQLAMERAKRLVEQGRDVFILLDSITRVGRAFNNATGGGGRTMSGGIDSRALEIPRKIFAAARNTEEAGSLTIIATALIDTGSKMDELIFQEFKGTGNMELVLDRKISDMRIYPAIDIYQSGTRREELLIPADDLHKIGVIRRGLSGGKPIDAIERLIHFLKRFPTNAQMLREIPG
jgi:transcription termination factor Rho